MSEDREPGRWYTSIVRANKETAMEFHGVDVSRQFKRMRELVPEAYRAFLEFDQKAFKDGAIPSKTKELIALGIAQITQCPWCIQAHTQKVRISPRAVRG
jgi:alkylhydroperoxidase/carboxymuconolactone decarboxylase family protein YurZ